MEDASQRLLEARLISPGSVVMPNRRLSAALRQKAELGQEPVLDNPQSIELAYDPAGDLPEVVDRILSHIAQKEPGGYEFIPLIGHRDFGIGGAESPEVFDHALGEAIKLGYIERKALDEAAYRLTMTGWKHLRELPAMERAALLKLADKAILALYEQELHDGYTPAGLIDALEVDESQVARVLRYVEKQGWIQAGRVFGRPIPSQVTLTPSGMRYAESLQARPPATPPPSIIYNLSGPNVRINIGSQDSSTNVVNVTPDNLFLEIRAAISTQIQDAEARQRLLERVTALEQSRNTNGFASRYADFMAAAANHVTVLAPFLPALTQLLGNR